MKKTTYLIIIFVLILAYLGFVLIKNSGDGKYSAVFLSDGQVYFGILSSRDEDFMRLTNVFYLKPGANTTDPQAKISLVKMGKELHGPKDEMMINSRQVMYYEYIADDSRLLSTIKDFNTTK